MGLDSVELVMAVEDTFGFSIPDQDAAGLDTVGKLYEYILAHRFHGKREACLSSITFYKLRRAMMSVLQIARNDVRVSTELSAIIPKHRRRVWQALEKATGFRLPQLRRPKWVTAIVILLTVGLAITIPMFFSLTLFRGLLVSAIFAAFAVGYVLFWLTTPLAFEFQPECTTAGQLAMATLARNYRAIVEETNTCSSDGEAWQMLCLIIADQLGVRTSDFTKETSFVKDLGVD